MTGKDAQKRLEAQYKRQNEFIKNSYDRISVTLPKGTKERIKAKGESVNGYITRLVLEDLQRKEQTADNLPDFMKDQEGKKPFFFCEKYSNKDVIFIISIYDNICA